jgi:purine-nucleoside phosphorylase
VNAELWLTMTKLKADLEQARAALHERCPILSQEPHLVVVLGSGLGDVANDLDDPQVIPFDELPSFPATTVKGHFGRLVVGRMHGALLVLKQGRSHLYEGHDAGRIVFPERVLAYSGARAILLTNAAGAVNLDYEAGDLMVIRDHLNLTGTNPLVGKNTLELGPRFQDLSRCWDRALGDAMVAAGENLDVTVREGVYAGMLGPNYETPAEVRWLRTIGADTVGMSTVLEAIAIHNLGTRVAGLSVISNAAAGSLGPEQQITHADVADVAGKAAAAVRAILHRVVAERASWWDAT